MIEIRRMVEKWISSGNSPVVIAVLIELSGSAVRRKGAVMAISPDKKMTGSVSGGCIEATVLVEAEPLFTGGKAKVLRFCEMDDSLFGDTVPCGSEIGLALTRLDQEVFREICAAGDEGRRGVWGMVIGGDEDALGTHFAVNRDGSVIGADFLQAFSGSESFNPGALGRMAEDHEISGIKMWNGIGFFFGIVPPPPKLVIIGASHIAIALTEIADIVGFQVTVIDPRSAFISEERFDSARNLVRGWPSRVFADLEIDKNTAVVAVTHDPKIDDQALIEGLQRDCYYIGALGSRKTHSERIRRLAGEGIPVEKLEKIHGPVGLDISAATPEEIGLAIMAEVVREFRIRYGSNG